MARIRTIKPEFWQHEALSALAPETHMLAAALLNYADDEGYFNANPKLVKAACCPLRDDSVTTTVALRELSDVGYIELGKASDGRSFGRIVKFCDHQTINKPKASKIKGLSITWESSGSDTVGVPYNYGSTTVGNGTGNGTGKGKDIPPTAGASAPSSNSPDPIFGDGLEFLRSKGVKDRGARSFLGKLRSDVGDLVTCELLAKAEAEEISDPLAWLRKAAMKRKRPRGEPASVDMRRAL